MIVIYFIRNKDNSQFESQQYDNHQCDQSQFEWQQFECQQSGTKMDEKAFNYEDEKYHKIIDNIGESFTSIIYKIIDTKTQKVMRKNVLKCDSEQVTFKDLQNAIKEFEFLHPCICYAIGINPSERNPDSDDKESPTVALFLEFADCKLADCQKKKKKAE